MKPVSEKTHDIVTVLDICVDFIVPAPVEGIRFHQTETMISGYHIMVGGSGCIFACQAAKLGLSVLTPGIAGEDLYGQFMLSSLKDAGLDLSYIRRQQEVKTAVSICLNKPDGDRAILTYDGSIATVGPELLTDEILLSSRHLHIADYFLTKAMIPRYLEVARRKADYGLTISLDTNWDPSGCWKDGLEELLPLIDVFFPNRAELLAISGQNDVQKGLEHLGRQIPLIVMKDGENGALAAHQGQITACPAYPSEAVDTIGAGDSFDAGFLYGFLRRGPLEQCLKYGCICGSMSTRHPGGTGGQITGQELLNSR